MPASLILDGHSLTPKDLLSLSHGTRRIEISDSALKEVRKSRAVIDRIVESGEVVYGVNTGFGLFSDVIVCDLGKLQSNLIRSHAAGTGGPLSKERTRMLLALRINVLCRGHSGVSSETLLGLVEAFNRDCISFVPEKGTVGASGDLAPLAHLVLGLMGEGLMWSVGENFLAASTVLETQGLPPLVLSAKEGLALINGTQLISVFLAEAVCRAEILVRTADVACALSLECLKGTPAAFHPKIHESRGHKGQGLVAARIRSLLSDTATNSSSLPSPTLTSPQIGQPSQLHQSHGYRGKIQDAYSLRCAPQVHGIVNDTLEFVRSIIQIELNSSTDNPMVFASDGDLVISGGNFHGEYPAKAADFLAIAVAELGQISERRIERLVNPQLSGGLPAFLVQDGGLNSGFMIAHCTAAALVSENKVLVHPASVDSISTSAAKEDHVSMGGFAARKLVEIIENVETVLAIELLAACQALEFHRPLKTTRVLEAVHEAVRRKVDKWDCDRFMAPDIEVLKDMVKEGVIWGAVEQVIGAYEAVHTV